jgi:tRNA-dihydrouridine synthase B
MREVTGCDAVMIGRGAQGNPWLFGRIREVAAGRPDPGPPTVAERVAVFRRHVALIVELKAGPKLIHELRKACAWYAKGMHGCNAFRQKVWSIAEPPALLDTAEAYFESLLAHGDRGAPRAGAAGAAA